LNQRFALWPFAVLSASYFAHIGFFNPYLPLWLQDQGLGLLAISLMTSMQSATRLFAPLAWGWLSDHTGDRVRLLRWCAMAALGISAGLWLDLGAVGVAVVLFLMFTHTSAMMPMSEAALAQSVSSQSGAFDARRYGRVRLWGSLGFLVTVMAAGAWFQDHGMASFPVWTVATLLAVTASTWVLPSQREQPHEAHAHPSLWPVLRQPVLLWFFGALFLHVLSHVFIYAFFSLYIDALGYGKSVIGLLWAFSVVVEIGFFYTQSRWLPLLRPASWLVLASALMTLRMAATAGAGHWLWALFAVQALHAITFAAHHSVCIEVLSRHFPARLRGRGQALYSVLGYGVSGVTGGFVGGLVSSHWGLTSVFWIGSAVALLATLAAIQVRRLAPPASGVTRLKPEGR
jgi:MFS transporter, PPP family, 3-phenylpropionic acid transporter